MLQGFFLMPGCYVFVWMFEVKRATCYDPFEVLSKSFFGFAAFCQH